MHQDLFGVDTADLARKKLFLFDVDGTLYKGNLLFDGTLQLLNHITEIGGEYVFISNNSSKSMKDYMAGVRKMGIVAAEENFMTSSQATVLYLLKHYKDQKIYCMGTASFLKELREAGLQITTEVCDDAAIVLVGFDTELTSEKLRKTCEMLNQENIYLATNSDLACPVRIGFIPDCGSICQMLENATGRRPLFIGKPSPFMVDFVRESRGYSKEETVVVGDRLYTDIASGINGGVSTVCVLTGEATAETARTSEFHPTFTFPSVKELWQALPAPKKQ